MTPSRRRRGTPQRGRERWADALSGSIALAPIDAARRSALQLLLAGRVPRVPRPGRAGRAGRTRLATAERRDCGSPATRRPAAAPPCVSGLPTGTASRARKRRLSVSCGRRTQSRRQQRRRPGADQRQVQRHRVGPVQARVGGRGEGSQGLLVLGAPVRPGTGPHLVEVAQTDCRAGQDLWSGGTSSGELAAASRAAPRATGTWASRCAAVSTRRTAALRSSTAVARSPDEAPRVVRTRAGQVRGLVQSPSRCRRFAVTSGARGGRARRWDRERRRLIPECQCLGAGGVEGEPGAVLLVQPAGVQVEGAGRCGEVLAVHAEALLVGDRARSSACRICARTPAGLLHLSCRSRQNGPEPDRGEPGAHDVEGRPLLGDEQHPLAAGDRASQQVRDRLRLAGSRRPFEHERLAGDGGCDRLQLRAVRRDGAGRVEVVEVAELGVLRPGRGSRSPGSRSCDGRAGRRSSCSQLSSRSFHRRNLANCRIARSAVSSTRKSSPFSASAVRTAAKVAARSIRARPRPGSPSRGWTASPPDAASRSGSSSACWHRIRRAPAW